MRVIAADSLGFCAGVRNAVRIAWDALRRAEREGVPCYIYGDIVHSRAVMDPLIAAGAVRIGSPEGIEPGIVVIRAHGIPDGVRARFQELGFAIEDATCPVVIRSQRLVRESMRPVIIIGNAGHSEIVSLMGSGKDCFLAGCPDDLLSMPVGSYDAVVQTTFSRPMAEEIARKADEIGLSIRFLNDICPASMERRHALEAILPEVDAVVVCGDSTSRNTMELVSLSEQHGRPAFLVSSPSSIPGEVFSSGTIGLTAGASCPDTLIEEVRRRLCDG